MWGSLDKLWDKLVELNLQGYGIYFCPNEVGGSSRLMSDLKLIRSIWQEDDNDFKGSYPLRPSLVVNTSHKKYHRYWLVDSNDLEFMSVEQFSLIMQQMVKSYGSDPSAVDLTRILRVPGFYHTKDKKNFRMITLDENNGCLYDIEELKKSFPPVPGIVKDFSVGWSSNIIRSRKIDLPLMSTDICLIAGAVLQIKPSCPYHDWIKVGMALKYSIGNNWLAFKIWDEWSSHDIEGYSHAGEEEGLRMKWQSFGLEKQTRRPVGVGSIIQMARSYGWTNEKDNFYINDEKQFKLDLLNKYFGILVVEGKLCVVCRNKNAIGDVDSSFWSIASFVGYFENATIPIAKLDKKGMIEGTKQISVSKVWRSWHKRRTYLNMATVTGDKLPVCKGDMLPTGCDESTYQLFTGLKIKPTSSGSCERILNHIYEVWCGEDLDMYEYVLQWLGSMMQKPNKPAGTCLVLCGDQGAGKGIIMEPLTRAFGNGGVICNGAHDIEGNFNSHLFGKILIYGNEVTWGGNVKTVGPLKAMITDHTLMMEKKGVDKINVPNFCHLVLSSNSDWVIPTDMSDRRIVILRTNDKYRGVFQYFDDLQDEIDSGGIAHFLWYLMNKIDIKDFKPERRPGGSDASRNVYTYHKLKSGDTFLKYWDDTLEVGIIRTELSAFEVELSDIDDNIVRSTVLYDSYSYWCKEKRTRGGQIISRTKFNKRMKEIFSETKRQMRIGSENTKAFKLSPLSTLKTTFLESLL